MQKEVQSFETYSEVGVSMRRDIVEVASIPLYYTPAAGNYQNDLP